MKLPKKTITKEEFEEETRKEWKQQWAMSRKEEMDWAKKEEKEKKRWKTHALFFPNPHRHQWRKSVEKVSIAGSDKGEEAVWFCAGKRGCGRTIPRWPDEKKPNEYDD